MCVRVFMHACACDTVAWFLQMRLLLNIFVPQKYWDLQHVQLQSLPFFWLVIVVSHLMLRCFDIFNISVCQYLLFHIFSNLFNTFQYNDDVMYEIDIDGL
jgi:hypothetical protein